MSHLVYLSGLNARWSREYIGGWREYARARLPEPIQTLSLLSGMEKLLGGPDGTQSQPSHDDSAGARGSVTSDRFEIARADIVLVNVLGASRRTDLPAFYYDWLQEALAAGRAELINFFNGQKYTVDLRPESIHSIVLWSRDYSRFLSEPGLLKNYPLFFQFTLTGLPGAIEPHSPSAEKALAQMGELAKKYSPAHINWRFDPLFFLDSGRSTLEKAGEERLAIFEKLCRPLAETGIQRCTISFAQMYSSVRKRLEKHGIRCFEPPVEFQRDLALRLAGIAERFGMKLYACCQSQLEGVPGVLKSSCINGPFLEELFGGRASHARDTAQRKECGCTRSLDIGSYFQLCGHGCLYCYARPAS